MSHRFVRGNKSDRNDAVAIAEASKRPNLTTVPIKSIEQQDIQSLHRIRERYVSHRTGLINQTRGLLSEYGIVCLQGHSAFAQLLHELMEQRYRGVTPIIKRQLGDIADDYYLLSDRLDQINRDLDQIAKANYQCLRLMSIPGIGVINAKAMYSAIGNGQQFNSGREFAVWLGLTPKQASS